MNFLALDTVSQTLSVTADGPAGRCTVSLESKIQHAETLIPLMGTALEQAGFSAVETDIVLCAEGPGSFTGLRIAYAAAKGIRLAAGCPLVPIPTLQCYAEEFRTWPGKVLSVLDARKKRLYVQLFSGGEPISNPQDCTAEEVLANIVPDGPLLITGPDAALVTGFPGGTDNNAQYTILPFGQTGISRQMIEIALRRPEDYTEKTDDYAGPEYVRKSDAETSRRI